MSKISEFLQIVRGQSGFKAMIKHRLFAGMMQGFEAVNTDMEELEQRLEAKFEERLELRLEEQKRLLTGDFSERLRVLDEKIEGLRNDLCAAQINQKDLRTDLENASTNLRNNNAMLERLESESELIRLKLKGLEKSAKPSESDVQTASAVQSVPAVTESSASDYDCIDYFDFENHFRGTIESIKKSQEFYLKYFRDRKNVIDIGCGRGEFLSLLKDNGISAKGVDIYEPYVDYCNMKGLEAVHGDGAEYLSQIAETDGIFVGQVVEHLKPSQIMRLCNTAYEKLGEGGCIVIETPNPTSLSIYTNAFYIDPSHIKPVHPLTMRYYLEKAGFKNIEIIYTESSRPPYGIPPLQTDSADNIDEFNEAVKRVSDMIFGSQDYAVIAVK